MKSGLLILPFVALLIATVGTAVGSSFPEAKWAAQIGWALAAGTVALWVMLDFDHFKALFKRKGAKYGASSGLVVVLGVAVIVGIAVITARPRFNKSIDLTRDRLNTLSDQSTKIIDSLKEAGEPVKITAFIMDEKVLAELRDLVNLYQARGANFEVEYVDPQVNPTRAMAEKVTEGNTVIVKRGAQEKRLSTFNEEKLTNALVNVLKNKSKKIYFTKGHKEGAIKNTEAGGYSTIVTDLEGSKNTVEEVSLLETAKVPDDADMLVIAGPQYDFKEEETRIIEDYLTHGGAVLAMVNAMTNVGTLDKMLEKFGVRLGNDLLILAPNDVAAQMYGQNNAIVTEFDPLSPVTKDFASQSQVALLMKNTRSLIEVPDNINKLKVTLAAKTGAQAIRVKDVHGPSDLENLTEDRWEMGAFPVIAVAAGKSPAPATAANETSGDAKSDAPKEGATSGQETRLIVIGSADFATNTGAQAAEHRDMFMNMTNYLLQDEDFIAIRPKDPTKSSLDLTSGQSQLLLLVLAFIYPLGFLGTGTISWLKRRRA